MRAGSVLFMLSFLTRAGRSVAFSQALPSCPSATRHNINNKLTMSASAAVVSLVSSEGDGVGGKGITLVPQGDAYRNVVVWLHGLGDTADGWAGSMEQFGVGNTKFILPTADARPITLNGGFQMPGWSDIYGLDEGSPEDLEGLNASADRVRTILEAERAKGKDFSRMVIGGFSQGGAVALHFCLRSAEPLAGCIACSSWVPMSKEYPGAKSSAAGDIPVSQFHGTRDEIVRFTLGQHSHNLLKNELGMTATFQAIPGMGHSACQEELEGIGEFLRKVLPE